jgi:phosphatidylserine/phosphatidylglycerophosphate/cardiolipin synthase-like enzyme
MSDGSVYSRLADIAIALADATGLDDVCTALEQGRLSTSSTAPVRAAVAGGNTALEAQLLGLQAVWAEVGTGVSAAALATLLRSCVNATSRVRQSLPITQVVWTGPKVEGSFLRATREVVRELLRGAQSELLVVGYWIAARDDGEGIIEEVIDSLAEAVRRNTKVTLLVDERNRHDGRNNQQILLEAWPLGCPLPRILTWRLPLDDHHLKLHAKVLVADRRDALVTSANLTFYAMDRNMEMGVRVTGAPAATIAQHFTLLERQGTIEPF